MKLRKEQKTIDKSFPCRNILIGVIGASLNFEGNFFFGERQFYCLNQQLCRSKDMIFLDVKHLKFSIEKYLNRCDQHIMEEFLFSLRREHFTVWISNLGRKGPLNFEASKLLTLSYSTEWLNCGTVEGWNSGSAEYLKTQNDGIP